MGGDDLITYDNLFQFAIVVIMIVTLVVEIYSKKK